MKKVFLLIVSVCILGTTGIYAQYDNGIIISNEGGAGSYNGSVDFLDLSTNTLINDIYGLANGGAGIGNVLQSIAFHGDRAYLVVHNESKIIVVDRSSFEQITTITNGLAGPRHVAFAAGKYFVSNQGTGGNVSVYDEQTNNFIGTIQIASSNSNRMENIIAIGDKVFVMHSSWGMGNSIVVIDALTNSVTNTIMLEDGLQWICNDENYLYAICGSSTSSTYFVINPATEAVIHSVNSTNFKAGWKFAVDNGIVYYTVDIGYMLDGNIYSMPILANAFPATPSFSVTQNSFNTLYGFGVIDGVIYTADAQGFAGRSLTKMFSADDFSQISTDLSTGTGTNGFYMNVVGAEPQPEPTVINDSFCDGDIYVWSANGQSYTEEDTYLDTLTASDGTDSIIQLNLVKNPTYDIVVNDTICEGTPYTLGTQSITTAGTYTDTLVTATGCDSVITLNLVVNPTYDIVVNDTICEGTPYTLGTQSITTAGTYTDTLVTATGCDSVITLNLVVNPTYDITVNDTIYQGEVYIFDEDSITDAGTYTKALTSVAGCDSTVTLDLVVVENTYSVTFNITDGDNPIANATVTFGGESSTTDQSGVVVFDSIADGVYAYSVSSDGYQDISGSVEVAGEDVTEDIVMLLLGISTEWSNQVSVYPNPASDFVIIKSDNVISEIVIYNNLGGVVYSNEVYNSTTEEQIDITTWQQGVYIIQVSINGKKYNQRIIIK